MTDPRAVMLGDLPKYRSERLLRAFEIFGMDDERLYFMDNAVVRAFHVGKGYFERFKPLVGGYFVAYPEGHRSFCDRETFRRMYRRVR